MLLPLVASLAMTASVSPTVRFPTAHSLELVLGETVVFRADVEGLGNRRLADVAEVATKDEPAEPVFLGYPHGPKTADWVPKGAQRSTLTVRFPSDGLRLDGALPPTGEQMACTDRADAPLISSYGGAASGLENGVYSRSGDWLLSVAGDAKVSHGLEGYRIKAEGKELSLVFKTDYYRNHLGYFLWDKERPLWPTAIAGWCSWAAYGQEVTEADVVEAADFFSKKLKPYGYDVVQIDDGFQRVLQFPSEHDRISEPFADYWTKPNSKFPDGMKGLAAAISSRGMIPGVWLGAYLPLGLEHSDSYVTDPDGKPHKGPWVGYSMDPYDDAAVAEAYTDSLKEFKAQGWRYFKVDTLRHILYDSYRQTPGFWADRHTDSSHAFRTLFTKIREALDPTDYLLACWGTLPELAGLPDGCRIGEDVGPSFDSMRKAAKYIAQFHYLNDVVWRNDPDYMCLRVPVPECRTWATLTSFAGGQVMVSDPIETYDAERLDVLRRVGPPLMTKPGNVVSHAPDPEWFLLPVSKSGESWTVAARMAWKPLGAVAEPLGSLGLDPHRKYLAFDFWDAKSLGVVSGSAAFHSLAVGECQVVAFRPLLDVPQVLGDDRHISQGVYELQSVIWGKSKLAGRFHADPGRAWNLYLHVPTGWRFDAATVPARDLGDGVVRLTFDGDGWMNWQASFSPAN